MSTSQAPIGLTPDPDGNDFERTGTVDVDGKPELDGDLNEDTVNSYGADQKAAQLGEVEDDEQQA